MNLKLKQCILGLLSLAAVAVLSSCGYEKASSELQQSSKPTIGVLLASHGDIDDAEKELRLYIETSFLKNVGIPLPEWSREFLVTPAFFLSVKLVRDQYNIIGPTHYRANAELQRQALDEAFKKLNIPAKAYLGYNFTNPFIHQALEQMKKDGIKKVIVFNKGAQFSYASSGENMEDTLDYLWENLDWNPEVIGYRHYSGDDRFRNVWAKAILADAERLFPGVQRKDLCIISASHGLPQWLIDKGDPAINQMKDAFASLSTKLPGFKLYHGFLNDDFFPGAKWVSPTSSDMVPKMLADGCQNILMDGRLSFTTHHRATLYDLNYIARNLLEAPKTLADGSLDPSWMKPKVVLAPNFDADPNFAFLLATLTNEALAGKGPIVALKRPNENPMKQNTVGKPGN